MENIKGYRDFRMSGTYVIRKLPEEAVIAELLIKSIKHNLENKIYSKKN